MPDSDRATDAAQRRLVIVESPAKAKTIQGYLGPGYQVEASVGHIRDLPDKRTPPPAAYKGTPVGNLGVDVADDFAPLYVVATDKKARVAELKRALKGADELLLATDEDREGEAIAWHLLQVLKPTVPVRRMVFHEITRDAIQEALASTRDLDEALVDAQEARRVVDRLYGYEVSPVLWKKVAPGLSAGRVQSVATRLVVERERERIAFVRAAYHDLGATFTPGDFPARLVTLDGARVATGRDFGADGALSTAGAVVVDEVTATALATELHGAPFAVTDVEDRPYTDRPKAPFMTSTLQQEASRKLRMSAQTTMRVAQRLYENGYITYMRTDSTSLSATAVTAARAAATQLFGPDTVPDAPRRHDRRVKNAQEAHEAIRPSGDSFRTPGEVAGELSPDERALYDLIWRRTVASQMVDATGRTVSVRIGARAGDRSVEFAAAGTVITTPGFRAAYEEGRDDEPDAEQALLPALAVGDPLAATEVTVRPHETSPPPRYTEATLVRALEERGIGRPSTYASIIGTILDRGYVMKRGSALVPSFLAFSVVTLLERHFPDLVDVEFTARLEELLDLVAAGQTGRSDLLRRFYYGDGDPAAAAAGAGGDGNPFPGLHPLVSNLSDIDAREINSIPLGEGIVLRVGRYGPYVQAPSDGAGGAEGEVARASVPDDMAPDELTLARAKELLAAPSGDRSLGTDPATGREVVARSGRYGPYVTEVLPEGSPKSAKPRTGSLLKSMDLGSVTLDDALALLALPRVVGVDPADGAEITAQNGRYGPYLKKGTDSRSLTSEEQIFTVSLPEALEIYAQPKARGRGTARPPLRELGDDPTSGRPVVVKEGRFGPYVTDGQTNATLRRGDAIEQLTLDRAAELLAEKRSRGPAPAKPRARRAAAAKR